MRHMPGDKLAFIPPYVAITTQKIEQPEKVSGREFQRIFAKRIFCHIQRI